MEPSLSLNHLTNLKRVLKMRERRTDPTVQQLSELSKNNLVLPVVSRSAKEKGLAKILHGMKLAYGFGEDIRPEDVDHRGLAQAARAFIKNNKLTKYQYKRLDDLAWQYGLSIGQELLAE